MQRKKVSTTESAMTRARASRGDVSAPIRFRITAKVFAASRVRSSDVAHVPILWTRRDSELLRRGRAL